MEQVLLKAPGSFEEILAKILQFIHTVASWVGSLIAAVIHSVLPSITIPKDLIEAIGLMAILTIFLLIVQVAKKLTWIVVIIGWALILVRIVLLLIKG